MSSEYDDELQRQADGYLQDLKTGPEAKTEWSEVACRIADALEHQVMGMLIMQLTSLGGKPEIRSVKHRAACPACVLNRQIVNQIQRAALIQSPSTGIIKQ